MSYWKKYMKKALVSEKSSGSKKSRSYKQAMLQLKSLKKTLSSIEKAMNQGSPSTAADRTIGFIDSAKFLGKLLKIFYIEWEEDYSQPDNRPHTGEQADQADWEDEWEKRYGKTFD